MAQRKTAQKNAQFPTSSILFLRRFLYNSTFFFVIQDFLDLHHGISFVNLASFFAQSSSIFHKADSANSSFFGMFPKQLFQLFLIDCQVLLHGPSCPIRVSPFHCLHNLPMGTNRLSLQLLIRLLDEQRNR